MQRQVLVLFQRVLSLQSVSMSRTLIALELTMAQHFNSSHAPPTPHLKLATSLSHSSDCVLGACRPPLCEKIAQQWMDVVDGSPCNGWCVHWHSVTDASLCHSLCLCRWVTLVTINRTFICTTTHPGQPALGELATKRTAEMMRQYN